jgi:nicotinic acid mononucleotide adenylyltransferase
MAPNDFIATDDSSTEIRERIKKGVSIGDLVPKNVEKYIQEKGLYR